MATVLDGPAAATFARINPVTGGSATTARAARVEDAHGAVAAAAAAFAGKFGPITDAVRAIVPGKPVIFAGLDDGAPVPPAMIAGLRAAGIPYSRPPTAPFAR